MGSTNPINLQKFYLPPFGYFSKYPTKVCTKIPPESLLQIFNPNPKSKSKKGKTLPLSLGRSPPLLSFPPPSLRPKPARLTLPPPLGPDEAAHQAASLPSLTDAWGLLVSLLPSPASSSLPDRSARVLHAHGARHCARPRLRGRPVSLPFPRSTSSSPTTHVVEYRPSFVLLPPSPAVPPPLLPGPATVPPPLRRVPLRLHLTAAYPCPHRRARRAWTRLD